MYLIRTSYHGSHKKPQRNLELFALNANNEKSGGIGDLLLTITSTFVNIKKDRGKHHPVF